MSANFLNTNRNLSRYFFATSEDGEQTLGLQFGTTGGTPNLSTMAVTISGSGGNGVIVNEAPQFNATEFVLGEEAVLGGGAGYFTPSTLTSNYTGFSLSSDRIPGTGIVAIESYAGNGSSGGYEFLARGVNGALVSTTGVGTNIYISSIGRLGATAVLGASGTFVTNNYQGAIFNSTDLPTGPGGRAVFGINDLSGTGGAQSLGRWAIGTRDIPTGGNAGSDYTLYRYGDAGQFLGTGYSITRSNGAMEIPNLSSVNSTPYPQPLLSSLCSGTQGVLAGSNVVTLLFSNVTAQTSNLIPGQNYLVDFPAIITTGAPGGAGAWLDLGVRLGGNGSFNYLQSMFIPPGGTPVSGVGQGVVQITDMGTANKNMDLVGYLQGVATLSISTSQVGGGSLAYMKMIT